ncbi:hypothetical protein D5086_009670 [Populus alba]|uniref:Uncharacterized protein n=1 Tax=Populus alba TaxID=43335 RepID=A0ACC4C935_POPAL
MALRRLCGFSDGELMRSDCKPCSRLMRQTAGIFSVGGAFGFWILCRLHYGMFYCSYYVVLLTFALFQENAFEVVKEPNYHSFYHCVCYIFLLEIVSSSASHYSVKHPGISDDVPDMTCPKGPRITNPRSLRWAACGAIAWSSTSALLVRLFSPECEPQNIAAYDKGLVQLRKFLYLLVKSINNAGGNSKTMHGTTVLSLAYYLGPKAIDVEPSCSLYT